MAFDTNQYAWKDVTVVMGGRPVTGIQGVAYTEKVEREAVYGKGNEPQAIQTKNKSYDGSIDLLQSELEALIKASPTGSILDLKLDNITISYAENGQANVITDQLIEVQFTESPKSIKQGDAYMTITLPIIFLRVKHQI